MEHVELVVLSVLALAGIGVLASRRRGAGRPLRRSLSLLIDSFALGLVMIAFLFLSAAFGLVEGEPAFETIRRATFVVIGLAPLAFLVALLSSHLLRSSVGDLFVELRANPLQRDVHAALARALRDPSLTLAYWLPDFGTYADLDGHPVALPTPSERRATTLIERDGTRVAALIHDPALQDEPELLDSVAAAAGIALENLRLQAELRARVEELSGSRARVVEAGINERQRLERNLHDGAQQRLVALSLDLGRLQEQLDRDPEVSMRLDGARQEIAASLAELRDVARGIHPAVVSAHGLGVTLEELAAHTPVPIDLDVEMEGRVEETVEVAAYYVVCESLANIGKHAHATSASDHGGSSTRSARRRGGRRRRRRGGHRAGVRAPRSRRPGGSARRPAPGLDVTGGRDASEGRAAVRVVIAEDSVLLREGLERLLVDKGFEVLGSCETAADLLALVRSAFPDVVIVDIRLPPTHSDEGLQAALEIRADYPSVGVLVLSQYVELGLALKLLADSADGVGYLLKDRVSDVSEFVEAVRRVGRGGSAIDPIIVSRLLARRRIDDPLAELTRVSERSSS